MNKIFETDRLILREFTIRDAPFIFELLNSEGWLRFIGDRKIHTLADAEKYLREGPLKGYAQKAFAYWIAELRENTQPVGICGLLHRKGMAHPDLGFAFLEQYQGKGYARELAFATLEYAHLRLRLPVIEAITDPYNTRSIRLLEKIGFCRKGPFVLPGNSEELLLFSSVTSLP